MKTSTIRTGLLAAALLTIAPAIPSAGQAPTQERAFDPRESLLAALGTATLECLGTVGPSLYETQSGHLWRTFRTCTTGDDLALTRIDAILRAQLSSEGSRDGLAEFMVTGWDAFTRSFPQHLVGACPTWTLEHVIDAPTRESVARIMRTGRVGVQYERYRVSSTACRGHGCAVNAALACARGFGSRFVVDTDLRHDRIEVDPAWWLLDIDFDRDEDNPFLTPGYCHGMSYYGNIPGALYGAIERAGEKCSFYDFVAGTHRCDGMLIPIDCGDGWMCMSYCTWLPSAPPAAPGR